MKKLLICAVVLFLLCIPTAYAFDTENMSVTISELLRVFGSDVLEGATIERIGANTDVDHYFEVIKGNKKYTVIRKNDGTFTNWSEETI